MMQLDKVQTWTKKRVEKSKREREIIPLPLLSNAHGAGGCSL